MAKELLPGFEIAICPWPDQAYMYTFERHHYMSGPINKSARSWLVTKDGERVAFDASLPGNGPGRWNENRLVVLPEFRGLGVGRALSEYVGEYHLSRGEVLYSNTQNETVGRARNASPLWKSTNHNGKKRPAWWSKQTPGQSDIVKWAHKYVGKASS